MIDKEVRKKIYKLWIGIKTRCYNKNRDSYKYYGGRGIVVCEDWKNNFNSFFEWAIKNNYRVGLTIDRKDVNGNYCPENCEFITMKEQCNNKTNTIFVEYNGERKSLSNWCNELELNIHTIRNRFYHGFPVEKLFSKKRYEKKGI